MAPDAECDALDALARALCPAEERWVETRDQGAAFAAAVNATMGSDELPVALPVAVGRAAGRFGLSPKLVAGLYLQTFATNVVLAAVRFIPLGAGEGQRIIGRLRPVCLAVAERAAANAAGPDRDRRTRRRACGDAPCWIGDADVPDMSGPLRVGIGGPVGAGKTTLTEGLCRALAGKLSMAVITNDIYTREDAEALMRAQVLPLDRIRGVETGGCPHTAIREDASINLAALAELNAAHPDLDLVLIESGGDNLAATFSPELADLTIYVIDTAAGQDIPRKKGPGLARADLLVVNKIDLAPHVGVDAALLEADARASRNGRPVVMAVAPQRTGPRGDRAVSARGGGLAPGREPRLAQLGLPLSARPLVHRSDVLHVLSLQMPTQQLDVSAVRLESHVEEIADQRDRSQQRVRARIDEHPQKDVVRNAQRPWPGRGCSPRERASPHRRRPVSGRSARRGRCGSR